MALLSIRPESLIDFRLASVAFKVKQLLTIKDILKHVILILLTRI